MLIKINLRERLSNGSVNLSGGHATVEVDDLVQAGMRTSRFSCAVQTLHLRRREDVDFAHLQWFGVDGRMPIAPASV